MPSPEHEQNQQQPKIRRQVYSREEVADLDPFGVRKKALEAEAEELERKAPPLSPEQQQERPDIQEAQEIFKDDFYGPEQIRDAFGVELADDEIPPQPFTRSELEHFQEQGYFLVLRIDHDKQGNPLTIKQLKTLYETDPKDPSKKIFYQQDWYEKPENPDPFYTTQTPKSRWALVKKEILDDSTSKNYQTQEQLLQDYSQQQSPHLEPNHQIQRREAPDQAYDMVLAYLSRGQRLLPNRWDWSKTQLTFGARSGCFAYLGCFDADGFHVIAFQPGYSYDRLGLCPSVVSEI